MGSIALTESKGKGSIRHNNRDFISPNVHTDRIKNNVIFIQQPIGEAYDEIFGQATQDYNAKQKRGNRKIKNSYFEHLFGKGPSSIQAQSVIQNNDKCKSFYEDIVQIGSMDDCGVNSDNAEIAKQCLIDYFCGNPNLIYNGKNIAIKSFQERNPQFKVFNSIIHMDEATPNMHIDYIPHAFGYKRGLSVQNGYNKALKQMGYEDKFIEVNGENILVPGFIFWRDNERDVLRTICKAYGLDVVEAIEEKQAHYEKLGIFIEMLRQHGELITEFDAGMWGSMVEYITVDKDKNMTVTFKDGSEVQA